MAINVMSTGFYPTGYTNNKATKAETGTSFADIVNQKAGEADTKSVQERTSIGFDSIGSQAPDVVKQAWMEAGEEIGGYFATGGLWITYEDGHVHAHMTQMGVQLGIRWLKGEDISDINIYNLLGNSVESAISVVEKCIYDMDHPLPGQPTRSIEVQQQVIKERAFYEAFLEKLRQLS